jgi:hypothetical protein
MEETKCQDCIFGYGAYGKMEIPTNFVLCGVLRHKFNMAIMMPNKTPSCEEFQDCD